MGLPSDFNAANSFSQPTAFEVNVRAESVVLPFCDQYSAITERRPMSSLYQLLSSHLARTLFGIVTDLGSTLNCLSTPNRNESPEAQEDNKRSKSSTPVPTKQAVVASVNKDFTFVEDDAATVMSVKNLKQSYGSEARLGVFDDEFFVIPGIRV